MPYCKKGHRCVCGGDTEEVRAGCGNWNLELSEVEILTQKLNLSIEALERIERGGGHCSFCHAPECYCNCRKDWEQDDPKGIASEALIEINRLTSSSRPSVISK